MNIKKCPNCFEDLEERVPKCPHCLQYIIDDLVEVDFHGADKKNCVFCGQKILKEAKVCKFCHRWFDDLNQSVDRLKDEEDLEA